MRPRRPANVRLASDGSAWVNTRDLQDVWLGDEIPETEQNRRYFGSGLTPATIEQVIRAADFGHMRDLTDLEYETVFIDPHLGSVIGKRFRALAAMKIRVVPATGDGIDAKRANYYAEVVRQQIAWVPNFRQAVMRLNWAHCHGRAALEKLWKENPGGPVQWRIDALQWIHPRRLSFGPSRELRLRDDIFLGGGFEARGLDLTAFPSKFVTFTPQLFNDYPEREGFGPRALYWAFFKRFSQRERLILLEVFGKPWRIVGVEPGVQVSKETLEAAADTVDQMGANASGRLPAGVKVETQQPAPAAGAIHREVITDADDQISKLVLGQSRTTDAKPGALGSDGDEVAQEEQGSIIAADGWGISEILTEQISVDIIRLNFGDSEIDHAPQIELFYELPPDRTVEIDRTVKALTVGVPLKEDEVYERIGFAKPEPGDRVVQGAPAAPPGGGLGGLPGTPPPSASPLGEGAAEGDLDGEDDDPNEGEAREADPLALARAARVLALLSSVSANSSASTRRSSRGSPTAITSALPRSRKA